MYHEHTAMWNITMRHGNHSQTLCALVCAPHAFIDGHKWPTAVYIYIYIYKYIYTYIYTYVYIYMYICIYTYIYIYICE